eukprot:CAMPEP_0115882298 /NCGR_PEP_ID=MMETSP0287-20121206/28926_1 /TAXON_ID=412157 /ORGANISM="Chrysochromulina rotalis, Strain UIO044" /LENGTH=59 /DNA_ID=CAMNT_0003338359 /DNA_START=80 /DNA_END=255 /DNA_ORIENTATION=-
MRKGKGRGTNEVADGAWYDRLDGIQTQVAFPKAAPRANHHQQASPGHSFFLAFLRSLLG